jgi:hypothetical protein
VTAEAAKTRTFATTEVQNDCGDVVDKRQLGDSRKGAWRMVVLK